MRIEAPEDAIRRAALDWTIRVEDSAFADWDSLTAWLQADPRHARCFDELAIRDAEAADLLRDTPPPPMPLRPTVPANDTFNEARQSHGWMRLAAGIAIPLALSGSWLLYDRGGETGRSAPTMIEVATRAGEQRAVTLGDGTRIAVAGATRLSIDPAARTATLLSGRATFRVVHDAAHPFSVRLGDVTVTDVGTIFDIRRGAQSSDIAVAEGVIRLDGTGGERRVSAGQIVRLSDGAPPEKAAIAPAAVGSWKEGRYDYTDASIAEIATDLTAATGTPVRAVRPSSGATARRASSGFPATRIDPANRRSAMSGAGWELDGPADADRR
jgi:transmembrane sensor